jgi:predicted MFS family arabinose efflux permease
MIGPIIAVAVAGTSGVLPESTRSAFVAALIFSIFALIPVLRWRSDAPTVIADQSQRSALKSAGKLLKNPKIFSAIYTSMAISSVGDILIVFLPLFGKEQEFSSMSIGVILAIRAGASMLSRLALGWLSAHFSTRKILLVSTLISTLSLAAMVFARNEYLLGVIVLVAGLALGVGQPLTMSLVSSATRPEERALAVSARLTGNRLGQFLLPAGAGALASGSGTSAVFIALALLLASTFIPPQS